MNIIGLINRFLPKRIQNNGGFLQFLPAIISAASSIYGAIKGQGDQQDSNRIVQLPDYPEANTARQTWLDTLQNWGSQPGYGAIQPDWAGIWDNAKQKVMQYYWGSPTEMGAQDRARASAARRNVSDSPVVDRQMAKLQAQEGQQLSDIATQESMAQAQLSEQGRQTWIDSLMGLAGLKPSFMGVPQQTNPSLLSNIGSGFDAFGNIYGTLSGLGKDVGWIK